MTKRRTRLFSLLLAFALVLGLASPALAAGETVAINEANFPDAEFRTYVAENFDKNEDNQLSTTERNAVVEIDVQRDRDSTDRITTLDGIEFFPNLKVLKCMLNLLTSLDVSQNTALTVLSCSYNKLTSLDISKNAALEVLDCGGNPLKSLDVSQNVALKLLYCYSTDFRSFEVSNNPNLTLLSCYDNREMTTLNVSGAPSLETLLCDFNKLTSLDVSHNKKLENLNCSHNCLIYLDLSKNTALKSFGGGWNTYDIIVGPDRTFDLSILPNGFDVSKTSAWDGGSVSGDILTVDAGAEKVTYVYDTGNDWSMDVTLVVTEAEKGAEVYRVYNPGNGKHHYTTDAAERDFLAENGWEYEGIAWYAPKEGAPIYRVYNPGNDNHLYTMDAAERDRLVEGGWNYEGILCYSAGTDGVPLYRVFNPYVTLNPHHYTDSLEECDFLESNGWRVDGISWYGLK